MSAVFVAECNGGIVGMEQREAGFEPLVYIIDTEAESKALPATSRSGRALSVLW